MRGRPRGRGLIPARAGTTRYRYRPERYQGAHPRSRGDHCCAARYLESRLGSSPLARGPPYRPVSCARRGGLIPARAGTTPPAIIHRGVSGAHPRSRGDHAFTPNNRRTRLGSSPLARGPPPSTGARRDMRGLIPARAGTTLADMGLYPLHQQNRITLKPEPASRIHDKQPPLTTTSTAILTRLTPP